MCLSVSECEDGCGPSKGVKSSGVGSGKGVTGVMLNVDVLCLMCQKLTFYKRKALHPHLLHSSSSFRYLLSAEGGGGHHRGGRGGRGLLLL